MLEEYIREQLADLEAAANQLTEQLEKLNEEEKSAEDILNSLAEHEDIGMEIFSPRSNESELKAKIEEQTELINELKYKEDQVADKISRNRQEKDKWKKLLKEALNRKEKEEEENFNRTQEKDVRSNSAEENSESDESSSFIINNVDNNNVENEQPGSENKIKTVHEYSNTERSVNASGINNTESSEKSDENIAIYRAQLENILERLNQCNKDLYSDRKKCGNELRNLQYYLKALINSYRKR